jgi:hypothetical protein
MSVDHFGGNIQPGLDLEEHEGTKNAKRVVSIGSDGTPITAATDDAVILLRRLVFLLQPQATQDIASRQLIHIDAVTNGVAMGTNVAAAGGGNGPLAQAPANVAAIYQPVWEGPVDQRWRVIDAARLSYDIGIRSKLAFT